MVTVVAVALTTTSPEEKQLEPVGSTRMSPAIGMLVGALAKVTTALPSVVLPGAENALNVAHMGFMVSL